jgi:hypothetical protein
MVISRVPDSLDTARTVQIGAPAAANSQTAPPEDAEQLWECLELERRLLDVAIDRGDCDHLPISDATLLALHTRLCQRFAPHLAGWRCIDPRLPAWPLPYPDVVRKRVRSHLQLATGRLKSQSGHGLEMLIEALAFLEGGLLALYPFSNLCEPAVRALMRLQLRQLGRPGVALDGDTTPLYLRAIQTGRVSQWDWLVPVWRLRLDWSSRPPR